MVDQVLGGIATAALLYMAGSVRRVGKHALEALRLWGQSAARCEATSRRLEAITARLEAQVPLTRSNP